MKKWQKLKNPRARLTKAPLRYSGLGGKPDTRNLSLPSLTRGHQLMLNFSELPSKRSTLRQWQIRLTRSSDLLEVAKWFFFNWLVASQSESSLHPLNQAFAFASNFSCLKSFPGVWLLWRWWNIHYAIFFLSMIVFLVILGKGKCIATVMTYYRLSNLNWICNIRFSIMPLFMVYFNILIICF